ncbi:hypothetical protein IW262DRAFT_1298281 [Armillaria fumosa]|nr:hypothetical protein IW262DRAFT_1298281 [Armillaria fumosa]
MSEDGFTKTLERLSSPTTITHLAIAYCVFWTQDHLIQALSSIKSLDKNDVWMAKIVSVTGPSLKCLNITLWPMMVTWDKFYNALDFDCHPNLEIIVFDSLSLGIRRGELDGRMKTRHIPAILRKITAPSIREVVLNLASGDSRIKDPGDLDSLDLESMGEILRQKNCSKLEVTKILSERMWGLGRPVHLYVLRKGDAHARALWMVFNYKYVFFCDPCPRCDLGTELTGNLSPPKHSGTSQLFCLGAGQWRRPQPFTAAPQRTIQKDDGQKTTKRRATSAYFSKDDMIP